MSPRDQGGSGEGAPQASTYSPRSRLARPANEDVFDAVRGPSLAVLSLLVRRWLPDGRQRGVEWVARNPTRCDNHAGSFSVNLVTGRWADFATGDRGGDVVSLAAYIFGLGQGDAARELARTLGVQL